MSEDVPDCKVVKPLLSGSIPVEQFVQTLEKVSLVARCAPRISQDAIAQGEAQNGLSQRTPSLLGCLQSSLTFYLGRGSRTPETSVVR